MSRTSTAFDQHPARLQSTGSRSWRVLTSKFVGCALLGAVIGCAEPTPSQNSAASGATGSSDSTASLNDQSNPATTAEGTQSGTTIIVNTPAKPETTNGFPTRLVEEVEELIRLTAQYNSVAEQVTDVETLNQRRAELNEIEERLSTFVGLVEIGTAKLSSAQQAEFDRAYFDTRAKPLIDAKRAHQERFRRIEFGS